MSNSYDGKLPGYRHLGYVVLHQTFMNFFRYPANAIGTILGAVLFFAMIFFGGQAVGFQPISNSTGGIVIGYYLFLLAGHAYQGVTGMITSEASWGTLERHAVSPFGFERVIILKGIAILVRGFCVTTIVLFLLMLLTGEWLSIPVVSVLTILVFTLIPVFGVGLAMGGLAVLYKRVSSITTLLSFAIIGLVGAPILEVPWLRVFPIVQGSRMLQRTMSEGIALWAFPLTEVGILVAVGIGYFVPGLFIFRLASRRARKLGVMGDY